VSWRGSLCFEVMCVLAGVHPGEALLSAMAEACTKKIGAFSAQNLSNTVHAFAKLGFEPLGLLGPLSVKAISTLDTFGAQVTSRLILFRVHHAWRV
jgi:hypothetical protein